MSNFPTVMNKSDLTDALASSKIQETANNVGVSFLKMDFESGEWLLGQSNDIVTDEEVHILTDSIQHGWILWSGGRPNKSFVRFNQPLPQAMESIGEDVPAEARSFQGALVDNGDMLSFDTNSYGGRKGVDTLLGAIKSHAAEGSQFLYPKIKLSSESYANKKRGGKLTYNPLFEIVSWFDENGVEESGAAPQVEDKAVDADDDEPDQRQRRVRKSAA